MQLLANWNSKNELKKQHPVLGAVFFVVCKYYRKERKTYRPKPLFVVE